MLNTSLLFMQKYQSQKSNVEEKGGGVSTLLKRTSISEVYVLTLLIKFTWGI